MALKRMTTEEMVQVSGPWTREGSPARAALLAIPQLASVLPSVEAAHQALHGAQPGVGDPRLAALSAEATQVDLDHDTLIRGVHMFLTSLGLLAGEGAAAAPLLMLRDFLLPDGLEGTQISYRAEAGAAELLKTRLAGNPALRKQLKDTPVFKHTLAHFVDGWMGRAQRLGVIEDERAVLATTAAPGDGTILVNARNKWIKAVNALVANAELAELGERDEASDRLLFAPLRLAEKNADRRLKVAPDAPPETPPAIAKPA